MILVIGVVIGLVLTGMACAEDGYMGGGEFMALWAIASAILVCFIALVCWGLGALNSVELVEPTASSRSGMGGDRVIEEIVEETRVEEVEAPRETATRQFDFGFREIEAGNFGGEK
jgi:hypothetical protein